VGVDANELRGPSTTGTGRWAPGPGETPGMPGVYLLLCADGSLYCGWTTDVQRRLVAHRKGTASRYTRSRRPIERSAIIPVADRSAALREEARIKRLPRSAKLRLTDRRVDSG
jgi:putative endonuclease